MLCKWGGGVVLKKSEGLLKTLFRFPPVGGLFFSDFPSFFCFFEQRDGVTFSLVDLQSFFFLGVGVLSREDEACLITFSVFPPMGDMYYQSFHSLLDLFPRKLRP